MSNYRYVLEKYKGRNTKHICPSCKNKVRSFVRYIDTETGAYIHESVGICDRVIKCDYHLAPKQYFERIGISFDTRRPSLQSEVIQKKTFYLPYERLIESLQVSKSVKEIGESNNFVSFLIQLFGFEVTAGLIERYYIGTSNHWSGSTVFWQIDQLGKIRTGKIMLYDALTGHRVKEPSNCIAWEHSPLITEEYELKQCLWGEHLLKEATKTVALVESEKTAIIASVFIPNFIWLSTGGLKNLNIEKCQSLKGRKVILYPDLKGFDKWREKVSAINDRMRGTVFTVSDYLEKIATDAERKEGLDIADYLIKLRKCRGDPSGDDLATESTHWLFSNRLLPSMIDPSDYVNSIKF